MAFKIKVSRGQNIFEFEIKEPVPTERYEVHYSNFKLEVLFGQSPFILTWDKKNGGFIHASLQSEAADIMVEICNGIESRR